MVCVRVCVRCCSMMEISLHMCSPPKWLLLFKFDSIRIKYTYQIECEMPICSSFWVPALEMISKSNFICSKIAHQLQLCINNCLLLIACVCSFRSVFTEKITNLDFKFGKKSFKRISSISQMRGHTFEDATKSAVNLAFVIEISCVCQLQSHASEIHT